MKSTNIFDYFIDDPDDLSWNMKPDQIEWHNFDGILDGLPTVVAASSGVGRFLNLLSPVKSILCNQRFDIVRWAAYIIIIDIFVHTAIKQYLQHHQKPIK